MFSVRLDLSRFRMLHILGFQQPTHPPSVPHSTVCRSYWALFLGCFFIRVYTEME